MSRVLPILFNTDMVQAILDGRKTVTRRIIKQDKVDSVLNSEVLKQTPEYPDEKSIKCLIDAPYEKGDILYIRETWQEWTGGYLYRAWPKGIHQPGTYKGMPWRPSIHMPKAAARIWLKVTDVRVDRLNNMTGQDILKEGVSSQVHPDADYFDVNQKEMFEQLWDSTIPKRQQDLYSWDANPWVWVIEFERCEKPKKPYQKPKKPYQKPEVLSQGDSTNTACRNFLMGRFMGIK